MTQKQEYELQVAVTDYIRVKYPRVQFRSDMAGVRLTPKPASEIKRIQKSRGFPDLFLCKMIGGFGGLFAELKVSREGVFTKAKDRLVSGNSTHLLEQCAILIKLNRQGYATGLTYGYDEAIDFIEWYMEGRWNETFYHFISIKEVVAHATEEQWRKALSVSTVDLSVLEGMLVL